MNIEDFKLNGIQNMENINPFVTFSREEYEKQMIERMELMQNFKVDGDENHISE